VVTERDRLSDINRLSRANVRRLKREADLRGNRLRQERDIFLDTQLEPGERVICRSRDHPIITDRRILSAHRRVAGPRRGDWVCEALSFAEITGYALGRRHDQRPLIRLEHRPIDRIEHVPQYRFLWFEWGNAEALVPHDITMLGFGKDSDPVFVALREALERTRTTQLEPFVVRLEGSRRERTANTIAPLSG
jgi:hypothetical protein